VCEECLARETAGFAALPAPDFKLTPEQRALLLDAEGGLTVPMFGQGVRRRSAHALERMGLLDALNYGWPRRYALSERGAEVARVVGAS
jgi:hypothetical protein